MSDRLLTEEKLYDVLDNFYIKDREAQRNQIDKLLEAQDAKTANYFETVVIPGRERQLIEEIDDKVFGGECYILGADDNATCDKCGEYKACKQVRWQQLKQKRGIE